MIFCDQPGWNEALAIARATAGFPPPVYDAVAVSDWGRDWPMALPVTPEQVINYAAICVRHGRWHCTGAQKTLAMRVIGRTARDCKQNAKAWQRWCEERGLCVDCRGKGTFESGTVCSKCEGSGVYDAT